MSSKDHKISLAMATIACVNAMVGASIFVNPAMLQTSVGPAALITYIGIIGAVWIMALALARVAALYPQEGAFYTYGAAWGGHTMGVIASGAYICGLTVAMGLLTRLTAIYLSDYLPGVPLTIIALGVIWSLVALNMAGATLTKVGQIVLVVLTLAPVALIIGLSLSVAQIENLTPFAPYGYKSMLYAIKAVIFGFFGFESATTLYALVEKPEKNVPRAISYSILMVGAIYLLFICSLFLGLPRHLFVDAETRLSDVMLVVFPSYTWLIDLIQGAIIITIMGTLHSLIWGLSELVRASLRTMGMRYQLSLRTALMIIGILASVNYLLFQNIAVFFNIVAFFIVLAYASSITALIAGNHKDQRLSTRILGYAGLIVCLFIMGIALSDLFYISFQSLPS